MHQLEKNTYKAPWRTMCSFTVSNFTINLCQAHDWSLWKSLYWKSVFFCFDTRVVYRKQWKKKKNLIPKPIALWLISSVKLKFLCTKMHRWIPFCKRNRSWTIPSSFHHCHTSVKHKKHHRSWQVLAKTVNWSQVAHAFSASALKLEECSLFTHCLPFSRLKYNAAQGFYVFCV